MAARKVKTGGGMRLTALLIAFLAISGVIVLRRSFGNHGARDIRGLESKRQALIDERLRLEADIRLSSSRAKLQAVAESKLGMRVPPESAVVFVTRDRREAP